MSDSEGPRTSLQRECAASSFDSRNKERVRALLDSGVDPNELDGFQRSPLNLLCSHTGHTETVRLLIEAGANVMSQDMWGRTPLHWCADRGWLLTAHLLLERGASVHVTTRNGDTVLLWAAKAGHHHLVKLFLDAGCDPRLSNNREERALDVAKDDSVRAIITSKLEEIESPANIYPVSPAAKVEKQEDIPNISSLSPSTEPSPKKAKAETFASVAGYDDSSSMAPKKTGKDPEDVEPLSTSSAPTNATAFSSYNKQTRAGGSGSRKLKISLKKS
ncbi:hypothetical protein R1flu_004987 [Riccia fluitans]|uniref:Uncharacterized protein n=1 Tax=Riccia fluitans TaxID=41844 RepID=A0ABD1YS72_9MARC